MDFTRPEVELSDDEYELGATMFHLLTSWRHWVHRRVEVVTVIDRTTSGRQQSIDFTMPPVARDLEAAKEAQRAPEFVPLTLLAKHRVNHFNLWDAKRTALPLITQSRSARIATATLAVAALRVRAISALESMGDEVRNLPESSELPLDLRLPESESIPTDVLDDLGMIAEGRRRHSLEALRIFGKVPPSSRGNPLTDAEGKLSREWRGALVNEASGEFLALANDVARAFIVLTPATSPVGVRQIIKLSYDQHRHPHPYFVRIIKDFVESALRAPFRGVAGWYRRLTGKERRPTSYVPARTARRGLRLRARAAAAQRRWRRWWCGWLRFHSQFRRKVERFFAIRSKVFHLTMPSLGRCECFHLEVAVPEGLQISRGTLAAFDVYAPTEDAGPARPAEEHESRARRIRTFPRRVAERLSRRCPSRPTLQPSEDAVERDVQVNTGHRLHLHLALIEQHWDGRASFEVRLRPSTLLFQVLVWAALSVVLLVLMAVFWSSFVDYAARALTVIPILVTILLALALRRDGEAGIVTNLLRGVRFIAFGIAGWMIVGLVILAGCGGPDDGSMANTARGCAEDVPTSFLFVIVAMALSTLLPLMIAVWHAWNPPPGGDVADAEALDEPDAGLDGHGGPERV